MPAGSHGNETTNLEKLNHIPGIYVPNAYKLQKSAELYFVTESFPVIVSVHGVWKREPSDVVAHMIKKQNARQKLDVLCTYLKLFTNLTISIQILIRIL